MTDNQFKSFRQKELRAYEDLMEILIKTDADSLAIQKLQILIDDVKTDIER